MARYFRPYTCWLRICLWFRAKYNRVHKRWNLKLWANQWSQKGKGGHQAKISAAVYWRCRGEWGTDLSGVWRARRTESGDRAARGSVPWVPFDCYCRKWLQAGWNHPDSHANRRLFYCSHPVFWVEGQYRVDWWAVHSHPDIEDDKEPVYPVTEGYWRRYRKVP